MRLATGFADGSVKLWDVSIVTDMRGAISKEPLILKGHTDSVNWLTFSPDGKHLASASEDQTVKIWDTATGKEQLTLQGHTAGLSLSRLTQMGRAWLLPVRITQ